jgi:hypothetical protein
LATATRPSRTRSTNHTAAAEVLGALLAEREAAAEAERSLERARVCADLEKLQAGRTAILDPLQRQAEAAHAPYLAAQAEADRLRAAWLMAAGNAAAAAADLDSREAVLKGKLFKLAPARLGRLARALSAAYLTELQRPVRERTSTLHDEHGRPVIEVRDGEAFARRETVTNLPEIAGRAKALLDAALAVRPDGELVYLPPDQLDARMREYANLLDLDVSDLDTSGD